MHNLSTGTYDVHSIGNIPFAKDGSNELGGSISFQSNKLALKVDGAVAARVVKAISPLRKRTQVSDCSAEQQQATTNALNLCTALSSKAATAAQFGDATKFAEYFGSTDEYVREIVANRFTAASQECSKSPSGGVTTTHCVDTFNHCVGNTLAYTVPAQNYIVNCPIVRSSHHFSTAFSAY